MTVVKLGIFDAVPGSDFECYTKDRASYEKGLQGCEQYETMPNFG
jgi:hypothetical protein